MGPPFLAVAVIVAFLAAAAQAADPFAFFDWDVSYITASPLGVPQQVRTLNSASHFSSPCAQLLVTVVEIGFQISRPPAFPTAGGTKDSVFDVCLHLPFPCLFCLKKDLPFFKK
jgi:hypothetical protein